MTIGSQLVISDPDGWSTKTSDPFIIVLFGASDQEGWRPNCLAIGLFGSRAQRSVASHLSPGPSLTRLGFHKYQQPNYSTHYVVAEEARDAAVRPSPSICRPWSWIAQRSVTSHRIACDSLERVSIWFVHLWPWVSPLGLSGHGMSRSCHPSVHVFLGGRFCCCDTLVLEWLLSCSSLHLGLRLTCLIGVGRFRSMTVETSSWRCSACSSLNLGLGLSCLAGAGRFGSVTVETTSWMCFVSASLNIGLRLSCLAGLGGFGSMTAEFSSWMCFGSSSLNLRLGLCCLAGVGIFSSMTAEFSAWMCFGSYSLNLTLGFCCLAGVVIYSSMTAETSSWIRPTFSRIWKNCCTLIVDMLIGGVIIDYLT